MAKPNTPLSLRSKTTSWKPLKRKTVLMSPKLNMRSSKKMINTISRNWPMKRPYGDSKEVAVA